MENSIAFITCVNDEIEYEECVRYINSINLPDGFEIEIIPVRNSRSMASGYNYAMKKSKSKYKVYLHQDTLIINKNIIYDILNIFRDESVGMMGVIGCEKLTLDAVWWNSKNQYGNVYESSAGSLMHLEKNKVTEEEVYRDVQALDGLIMITQYDIPWREDIFDGYHFYDISQCIEFNKNDLKVVVPYQEKTWCLHDCKRANMEQYDRYRKVFLKEYSKDIYPLVSILIPTYNRPEYFEQALLSALNQTYLNTEIIVGDNSDNDNTKDICAKYLDKFDNLKYLKNEVNLGMNGNLENLCQLASGRYVNFLMDDDIFEYSKIEKMIRYFIEDTNNEMSLVSSNRRIIDSAGRIHGNFINDTNVKYFCNFVWKGQELIDSLILLDYNFVGEPTTVLFDKSKLDELYGRFNGRRFMGNLDLAAWYNLLKKGNAIILSEPLSRFRLHDGQEQKNTKIIVNGMSEKLYVLNNAREYGFLSNDEDYKKAIEVQINSIKSVEANIGENKDLEDILEQLKILLCKFENTK